MVQIGGRLKRERPLSLLGAVNKLTLLGYLVAAAVTLWRAVIFVEETKQSSSIEQPDWCQNVALARAQLTDTKLHVSYPCEGKQHATSAIVTMITGGVSEKEKLRNLFSVGDYVHGAMALGASIQQHVDMSDTHQLLFIKEGLVLTPEDRARLEAVGWTLGTTPTLEISAENVPNFPRYKTTYTKLTALGLAEYKCVLFMDADTLVVGPLDEILDCKIFNDDEPQYKLAGVLDYYHYQWQHFNTGSMLWRTSAEEMMRIQKLTRDASFMKRFESDQIFLNNVYPDRMNKQINQAIVNGTSPKQDWGSVFALPWDYNAQTHVEVQLADYWIQHRSTVKIIHFTEKKGWQCEERHEPPPPSGNETQKRCNRNVPMCFCREAHLWWDALRRAEQMSKT